MNSPPKSPEELWVTLFGNEEQVNWSVFAQKMKKNRLSYSISRGFKYWLGTETQDGYVIKKSAWSSKLKHFPKIICNSSYVMASDLVNDVPTICFVATVFSTPYFTPSTEEQTLKSGEFAVRLSTSNMFTIDFKNNDGSRNKVGVATKGNVLFVTQHEQGKNLPELIKNSRFKDYKPHEFLPLCIDKGEKELLQYFKQQCNGNESEALKQYKEAIQKGIENVEQYV